MTTAVLERVARAVHAALRGSRDFADLELVWRTATDEEQQRAIRVAQAAINEYLAAIGNTV